MQMQPNMLGEALLDGENHGRGPSDLDERELLRVLMTLKRGDFSARLPEHWTGVAGKIADTLNEVIDMNDTFAKELARASHVVGKEGDLTQRVHIVGAQGAWAGNVASVNELISDLVQPTAEVARVIGAVARGDLTHTMAQEVGERPLKGEFLRTAKVVNTMVLQLSSFASEVTRVAREVGTDGKLGGQAEVIGVAGTWKDLTDNVNSMATNLTTQVRGIARVVTAVAMGDLKRKLVVEAKGEIAELANTINAMIDTLAIFADQVTSVAREVGIDGKLGGQASVPGSAGIWRDLTDNVNQLAANLTTQVRAIAEVATAVTRGDLTRSISVAAEGEVAALKDNINEMIRNLRDTTRKNSEQDWLKTNFGRFTRMLQGQRDLAVMSKLILSEIARLVSAQHGVFFLSEVQNDNVTLRHLAGYAYKPRRSLPTQFRLGEGLVGQCAAQKERMLINDVPGNYVHIHSGLGEATPVNLVVLPVVFEGEVRAVIELASFQDFSEIHLAFLDQLMESIGIVLNTIAATMRTEELLKQSQALAQELQSQQEELTKTNRRLEQQAISLTASEELLRRQQDELQATNAELQEKARLLSEQNAEVERKSRQIELAKQALEEKAEQLALTSKYKSEFLANMSHELRTPLNSLLILARLLSENTEANLSAKQVEFARTIHASGSDLLALINDILDLSKIESGTMVLDMVEVPFTSLQADVDRTFRHVAQAKNLGFVIKMDSALPLTVQADSKRLQQVLKNLLSNAFKFTEHGEVTLTISRAKSGWSREHATLNAASGVVSFAVSDTGIGIPHDKLQIIFEAFQQADGTTSRKYGGTGLGLSISRELVRLLGGEIRVQSKPGVGSTFAVYLPLDAVQTTGAAQGEGASALEERLPHLDVVQFREYLTYQQPAGEVEGIHLNTLGDDRDAIGPNEKVVLIVEDDVPFARILMDMSRERGFKVVVAVHGRSVVPMARLYKPSCITLDINLPDSDGWTVLDRLKHDAETCSIPVHVISVAEGRHRALTQGAIAYLEKPVERDSLSAAFDRLNKFIDRPMRNLLVVEDDDTQRNSVVQLLADEDLNTTAVGSGEEALAVLRDEAIDCMVLDLGLPDMTGFALIERIKNELGQADLPIIIYTGRDLTRREESQLRKVAHTIIVKDANSPERLLAETALFLHRVESKLSDPKKLLLTRAKMTDTGVAGRTVLVVDDDVRNIFAMTSILERHLMKVQFAENGRQGIEVLEKNPGIDVVLMDVMMPGMDGYETMRAIRALPKYKKLPIIALTAKAMKGDREKCIEAGATDYITKPVDTEQLMSLLRVWLYNQA